MKRKTRIAISDGGGGWSEPGSDSNDHKDNYQYGPANDDDLPF